MSDWTQAKNNPDLPDAAFKEIEESYKNNLKLPKPKLNKRFLLCPIGIMASGKTTVLKPLSERLGLVRVSSDEIRKILKDRGFNYNRVKDITFNIVKEMVAHGRSVAIDAGCGGGKSLEKIWEIRDKYNIDLVWIHVNPPEDFIINKLRQYKHDWLFKDANEAVMAYFKYKEKYGDFKNLDFPYVYTFDTSKRDINKQIDDATEIIKKLEK